MKENTNKNLEKAVDLLISGEINPSSILQEGGLMKQLTKALVERALQAEMKEHLGYDKYGRLDESDNQNYRNGEINKKLITEQGTIDISVPRDRNSKFEPAIVKKRQNRIAGLDEKILSLYAKGMSTSDIRIQLEELYGADISESLISRVTDDVIDEVKAWQNRPLDKVYPIVFFDCLVIKVREDKRIINKSVYIGLAINSDGIKDILGLWVSENEGSKFWLSVFTELKNRGTEDILIACTDNLTGMSDAIGAVFEKTEHQICIVHQIRNSLRYVSYKDRKEVASDLKEIYTANSEENALIALESFAKKWDKKYPQIARSWQQNWTNLAIFFCYPPAIKKIIYTTNIIESVNSRLRKVTNNKRVFPNDMAVFKTLYLTIEYLVRKWTTPVKDWNQAMAHFLIKFDGRI